MFKKKSRFTSFATAAIVALSSTSVLAQTTIETTTLLNCGYTKETHSNSTKIEGTRSAGHMSVWDQNCKNRHEFDYKKTHSIALTVNNTKIPYRIGSSHIGCSTNDSKAKIASKVVWNKRSNYILVNRNNVKDKTYVVAIPKTVGLDCGRLWSKAPLFTRYQEIK